MPIYEYKCKECGTHFEKIQKTTDEPLKVCLQCGGELEKQWSLSGFQFKGEGWYATDYANKKSGSKAETSDSKTEKSETSEKKSASESTAETETASKKTSDKSSDSKKESKKD